MLTISASIGKTPYLTEISTGAGSFIADEPLEKGGGNRGPKPRELLAASLASCTAITLRMYADRKQYDLGLIRVDVSVDREPSDTETRIVSTIYLEGNLTEPERERMLAIAKKCPVHLILQHPIKIDTLLA
jgi:putative redox protein